jgi:hypothetical protein
MKKIPNLIIQLPPIDPEQLKCTCGADKDGFVSFWFHKPECKRYQSIACGFEGTCFEDKELSNDAPIHRD